MAQKKRATKTAGKKTSKKKAARRGTKRPKSTGRDEKQTIALLRSFVREKGTSYLEDGNVTSIGIGYKVKDGKPTRELCIQFTVRDKPEVSGSVLEDLGTRVIPKAVSFRGVNIPTDVLQRDYRPAFELVEPETLSERRRRRDPMVPGISVSHPTGTAGTLGLIVFDNDTGAPCILSNWHVLHGGRGKIGDTVVQPGPFDDNRTEANSAATLLRSHLGLAGDMAIARISERGFDQSILELGAVPRRVARPELGDRVIKSGRTTGVTHGVVRRTDVVTRIAYAGAGPRDIGCFEIGLPEGADPSTEVSKGGDSGSSWLVARDGNATDIFVGLHFAGESGNNPDEHALACVAPTVLRKMNVSLSEPAGEPSIEAALQAREGFDAKFLKTTVALPTFSAAHKRDAVTLNGSHVLPYTHFSVCLSRERRLPRFVAWNIDGSRLRRLSRKGIDFRFDPRIPDELQAGEELYRNNPLDRGHVARRADLVWGTPSEARRANRDSFYFTNITPQHQSFNQSSRGGLWGELENAIFDDVEVEDLRISVLAGPLFQSSDPEHRGFRVPNSFWKVVAFRDEEGFKASAYLLTQRDLVSGIEALDLDPFRVFQVSLDRLEREAGLGFGRLKRADTFQPELELESVERVRSMQAREIRSRKDLAF